MKEEKVKAEIHLISEDYGEVIIPVTKNYLLIFKLFAGGNKMKKQYDKFFFNGKSN